MARKGTTVTYRVKVKNVGDGQDDIAVQLDLSGSTAIVDKVKVLRVSYHADKAHPARAKRTSKLGVTSKVTHDGYTIQDLDPGSYAYFLVQVTLDRHAHSGRTSDIVITTQSLHDPSVTDVVRGRVTVR